MSDWILLIHAAATWCMVGLIWFVQVVHYPLFRFAGEPGWPAYASAHRERTTWVVMPPMATELATAALLAYWSLGNSPPVDPRLAWAGLALLIMVWGSTFIIQVPLHARLASKLGTSCVAMLVRTNWVRTILWTIRGGLAVAMLSQELLG